MRPPGDDVNDVAKKARHLAGFFIARTAGVPDDQALALL